MGRTLADDGIKRGGAVALAAVAAVFFFGLALSHALYAPGAAKFGHVLVRVSYEIFGEDAVAGLDVVVFVRKAYSIVAFTLVGIPLALAFRRPSARYAWAVAGVALLSAAIKVLQKLLDHSPESFASNLFDVACGAAGGAIGAAIAGVLRRRAKS